jgi:hypothetical protein
MKYEYAGRHMLNGATGKVPMHLLEPVPLPTGQDAEQDGQWFRRAIWYASLWRDHALILSRRRGRS